MPLGIALFLGAAASAQEPVRIEDAEKDDYGAGGITYPQDKLFTPGAFDLTEFRAIPFSGGVRFEIDFATRIPQPPDDRKVTRTTSLRDLQNHGLFLQNIDIYIDQDGRTGSGSTDVIPGRNAEFDPDSAWEKAVLITPQPSAAGAVLRLADAKMAEQTFIPDSIQLRGKTLSVEVPDSFLDRPFSPNWGYTVAVTAASFEESFRLIDPNIQGIGKSVFARVIRPSRDDENFGGGTLDGLGSNILDLILPPVMDQKAMLTPRREEGKWPLLHSVFPNGRPSYTAEPKPGATPEAATTPGAFEASVVDIDDGLIVVSVGKTRGVRQGALGRVLDARGQTVARFVISELLPDFSVGKLLGDDSAKTQEKLQETIQEGMKVELKMGDTPSEK